MCETELISGTHFQTETFQASQRECNQDSTIIKRDGINYTFHPISTLHTYNNNIMEIDGYALVTGAGTIPFTPFPIPPTANPPWPLQVPAWAKAVRSPTHPKAPPALSSPT